MNILNDQIFAQDQGVAQANYFRKGPFNPFLRLATKPSTQRRDWQKDGFKMFINLLHSVLSTIFNLLEELSLNK